MKGGMTMPRREQNQNRENDRRKQNAERLADVELGQEMNAARENENENQNRR